MSKSEWRKVFDDGQFIILSKHGNVSQQTLLNLINVFYQKNNGVLDNNMWREFFMPIGLMKYGKRKSDT